MTHLDAAQLIERCRAGDEEAVTWLVQANQAAVFRLALSILDDPAEADEATQETFLAALRNSKSYRAQAALRTWLFAIAINVCRSRLRQSRTRQRLQQLLHGAWLVGDDPVQPETAATQREAAGAVWRAVQALGEKHRLPVILRYYHDLPVAEIGAVLNISPGTVHSRLSTARDRLHVALQTAPAVRSEVEPRWQA